ncbi:hypothetical protein GCM10017557_00760 [Streptomyces aurantiacus]|uniref:Uncharacterized protein n=1 Tax=Streptomyces aurantiacus TaxID=47760 RepID=A0A7G1NUC4_9ACTN|nr:hypothetical protein GCM10017557_00760 [Streptomyces aurantiacus]
MSTELTSGSGWPPGVGTDREPAFVRTTGDGCGSAGAVADRVRRAGKQAAASPAHINRLPRTELGVRCSCRTKTPRTNAANGSARLSVPTAAALVEVIPMENSQ